MVGACHSIVSDFGGFMKTGMQFRSNIHIHTACVGTFLGYTSSCIISMVLASSSIVQLQGTIMLIYLTAVGLQYM